MYIYYNIIILLLYYQQILAAGVFLELLRANRAGVTIRFCML